MSVYLAVLIIAATLCALTDVAFFYARNRLNKRYELLEGLRAFMEGLVMLTFVKWVLDKYLPGSDSNFGWWMLAAVGGIALAKTIGYSVSRICGIAWTCCKDKDVPLVKMSKGLRTAVDIMTFIMLLCFDALLVYVLLFAEVDLLEKIIAFLGAALLSCGVYYGIRKFIKQLKQMGHR